MSFTCPRCQRPDTLRITHTLELPPDGRSDEITLQVVACENCRFRGTAVYEESRRGAADSWHHDGYIIANKAVEQLEADIEQCPDHGNRRCHCPIHQKYSRTDENGRWHFPFTSQGMFSMNWHKGGQ